MQGGRDPFFNPFGTFHGFANDPRSLLSNFFGGRDPFDDPFFSSPFGNDPFFTRPFGNMASSFFGPSMNRFQGPQNSGFLENQPYEPRRPSGPIIKELNSDGKEEEEEEEASKEQKDNPRKQARSSEEPDDEVEVRKRKQLQFSNGFNQANNSQLRPQAHSFTFQSSTVSYGGPNGPYYTSSTTRRTGSDGLSFEESKEANSSTRQAIHSVSRGIHDKGHSVTRKLMSDGKVDTMQMLHNLNEDELTDFDKSWKGKAKELPGLIEELNAHGSLGSGPHSGNGWALPAAKGSNENRSMNLGIGYRESHDPPGSVNGQGRRGMVLPAAKGSNQNENINLGMGYRASQDPPGFGNGQGRGGSALPAARGSKQSGSMRYRAGRDPPGSGKGQGKGGLALPAAEGSKQSGSMRYRAGQDPPGSGNGQSGGWAHPNLAVECCASHDPSPRQHAPRMRTEIADGVGSTSGARSRPRGKI